MSVAFLFSLKKYVENPPGATRSTLVLVVGIRDELGSLNLRMAQ
jgi:hypothetical protein